MGSHRPSGGTEGWGLLGTPVHAGLVHLGHAPTERPKVPGLGARDLVQGVSETLTRKNATSAAAFPLAKRSIIHQWQPSSRWYFAFCVSFFALDCVRKTTCRSEFALSS